MDVLLIGGTRFLGPLLVMRLLAGGHKVTILNRGTRPDPFGAFLPRIEGFVADRRSPEFARALSGRSFDAVVDFAAYEEEDVTGAIHALEGRCGHYVLISTGQVYLVREGCPTPARESDYLGPLMPRPADDPDLGQWQYGMGKRACEDALARAFEERRFPFTSLRIPVVNGERDYNRRLDGYLFRLMDGGPILLPDGGRERTRHVYSGEVVRALATILGDSRAFGHAFNVCQPEMPTVREIVLTLADHLGASPRLVDVAAKELVAAGLVPSMVSGFSRGWMSILDPDRFATTFGFEHIPFRDYMARIVACFLAAPPTDPPPTYAQRDRELQLAATRPQD